MAITIPHPTPTFDNKTAKRLAAGAVLAAAISVVAFVGYQTTSESTSNPTAQTQAGAVSVSPDPSGLGAVLSIDYPVPAQTHTIQAAQPSLGSVLAIDYPIPTDG